MEKQKNKWNFKDNLRKSRILNVGCGNSDYGTERIDIHKTKTTTKVVDIDKEGLPYPNNYFDEIYCKSVIEHLKNLGLFASECHRVLKKNGKLWIRTDNAGYIVFHLLSKHEHNKELERHSDVHNKDNIEDAHYHLFVESHLDNLFRSFSKREFSYFYGGHNPLLRFIARLLPKHMGAFHIEMTATK